jgi:hypothetical protein
MSINKEVNWSICKGLPTRIYRNLLNGKMSLKQQINKSWLVIGHVTEAVIKMPKFYVSEPGRQRVISDKRKNVHAFGCGILVELQSIEVPEGNLREIHYCPYSQPHFTWKDSSEALFSADLLIVIENRVFCTVVGEASSKKLNPQLAQGLDLSPFSSPVV